MTGASLLHDKYLNDLFESAVQNDLLNTEAGQEVLHEVQRRTEIRLERGEPNEVPDHEARWYDPRPLPHTTPCADVEAGNGCEVCDAFENEAATEAGHEDGCDYTYKATMQERLDHYAKVRAIPMGPLSNGYAEASEVGFAVGEWPEEVTVAGLLFTKARQTEAQTDYVHDAYVITIIND